MSRLSVVVVLAVLAGSVASGQPAVLADSIARRPPLRPFINEDAQPLQTSAVRAYVYSAAATGGLVLVGILVDAASDASSVSDGSVLDGIGPALIVSGVMMGPSVGNMTLGAVGDVKRAARFKMIGVGAGMGLAAVGLGTGIGCVLSNLGGGGPDTCGSLTLGLFVSAAVVASAGAVVGGAYDLATIPRNAERARQYRQAYPRVSVVPGWSRGAPALAVRVGL